MSQAVEPCPTDTKDLHRLAEQGQPFVDPARAKQWQQSLVACEARRQPWAADEAALRDRTEVVAWLTMIANGLDAAVPAMVLVFSAPVIRNRLASAPGDPVSHGSMQATLDALWRGTVARLHRQFMDGLSPLHAKVAALMTGRDGAGSEPVDLSVLLPSAATPDWR